MSALLKLVAWFAVFGQPVVKSMAGHGKAASVKRQLARIRDAITGQESGKKLTVLDREKLYIGTISVDL